MSRRTPTVLAAGAAGLALALAPFAPASAQPEPTPTAQAREAGITAPGEAAMGWTQHSRAETVAESRSSAGADTAADTTALAPGGVPGIDVSSWQGSVDWAAQWGAGKRFAYAKASEGATYRNPSFAQQYNGSYAVGMTRGAYHFALPDVSSGASQADHFLASGGGWSADGRTLPGALDMEWNPYGATCYGKTQAGMRTWIKDFVGRYKARTGRSPVIYTATSWWSQCVGADTSFAADVPLWIARYSTSVGTLPAGWGVYSFWQYSDTPIDQNVWNGSLTALKTFARG